MNLQENIHRIKEVMGFQVGKILSEQSQGSQHPMQKYVDNNCIKDGTPTQVNINGVEVFVIKKMSSKVPGREFYYLSDFTFGYFDENDKTKFILMPNKWACKQEQSNQNLFKGWTQEEIDYYNNIPKTERDQYYRGYTPEEIHDSIKTRMMSSNADSEYNEKLRQGLVPLGDDNFKSGYGPKFQNKPDAGQPKDQNWYKRFTCLPGSNTVLDFEGTPALVSNTLASEGVTVYYFYDGSVLVLRVDKNNNYKTNTQYWFCNGNQLETSSQSGYNVWVPKSDPRSQAEKFAQTLDK